MKNDLSREVAITVEDVVDRKLQDGNTDLTNQIQTSLDTVSNKIVEENTKVMTETINEFKCITLEQLKNQQPKSFIDRIFHLKK